MNKKDLNTNPEKVDFDKFAGQYENILTEQLNFFGEESSYFAEYKIKQVRNTINTNPGNILEFGCGIGRNLKFLAELFPNSKISGCDVSEASLDIAKKENPDANLFIIDDEGAEKYKNNFDLIFISCVFHHIQPSERNHSITTIYNMLAPKGVVYIFEHNPYNPVTRHIVKTCPWDTDAILLKMKETVDLMTYSGLKVTEKIYTLFFPASFKPLRFLENYFRKIPMGGQYYVKGVKDRD